MEEEEVNSFFEPYFFFLVVFRFGFVFTAVTVTVAVAACRLSLVDVRRIVFSLSSFWTKVQYAIIIKYSFLLKRAEGRQERNGGTGRGEFKIMILMMMMIDDLPLP